MNLQNRIERLKKAAELAKQDHARMAAQLAALLRKNTDNVVELAMVQPMVDAAYTRMIETEARLRAATGGVKHRTE